METIFYILLAIAAWFVFPMFFGNVPFWRLAAKYPDRVYTLIQEDEVVWLIDDGTHEVWATKNKADYTGPFRLYVPSLDQMVKIWGRADRIEEAQAKIAEQLKQ